ncbi:hypothetical protein ACWD4G_20625 [Streptomyces sp. NPDC002643]
MALRQPVGPAADLYALGCVLYELPSGQAPFTGPDAAGMLYRHVHEAPAGLAGIRPSAPPEPLHTVHTLLAKNPADRPHAAAGAVPSAPGHPRLRVSRRSHPAAPSGR